MLYIQRVSYINNKDNWTSVVNFTTLPLWVVKVNNNQQGIAHECNKESNSVPKGKKMAENRN